MELFLFATDPLVVAEAVAAGAAGGVVDWERRGKTRRQAGADTQINADTSADLARVRAATDGRVLCRINAWGPWTAGEVRTAITLGADEVLLPMVRATDEVDATLDLAAGRIGVGILIETQDAVGRAAQLAARPLSRVYLGLNDLRIDRGRTDLFEPLVDGTADSVRSCCAVPFGVAGLTVPEGGSPVPSRLLAGELARLSASFTFLRRSFLADVPLHRFRQDIPRIQAAVQVALARREEDVAADRIALQAAAGALLV
ncbi:MAG TPA: hypothetical protein VNA30_04860 [Mycobacteriales bacterium]|nr:hypothetical protein [Mycobacteriales bacterium]